VTACCEITPAVARGHRRVLWIVLAINTAGREELAAVR
jgi:hypothetical protein